MFSIAGEPRTPGGGVTLDRDSVEWVEDLYSDPEKLALAQVKAQPGEDPNAIRELYGLPPLEASVLAEWIAK